LAVGRAGTADHVERIVRGWRRVDRNAEARENARRHTNRALRVYQDEDGMVVLRGRLAPEVGAVLIQALRAAREALYQHGRQQTFDAPLDVSAQTPPMAQQQADALALLAETALHHGTIARFMRKAIRSIASPTANSGSVARMANLCPTSRRLPR